MIYLDITSIFLFLSTFVAVLLTVLLILPDKEILKAQKILKVRDEALEDKYLLLKYTKGIYKNISPYLSVIKLPKYRGKREKALIKADLREVIDVDDFLALKFTTFLFILAYQIISSIMSVEEFSLGSFLLWCIAGLFIPDFWLYLKIKKRERAIMRELPYFIDLLTLSVEAGLDFVASITRITEKQKNGVLSLEFEKMLKEIKLGTSRADALKNLSNKLQITEVSSFLSVLIQASQLGISIGNVLRIQSDLIREQRFQKAEKAGAQATQKLLVPLIFFILPALIIVIFGPIILDYVYGP